MAGRRRRPGSARFAAEPDDLLDTHREPEPPADPVAVARELCLRQLERAPRTRAQLADMLRRRGVPDDAAEVVLGRLADVGLVDDAAFAAAWVSSRHAGRGLARRALSHELRQRGVEDSTVAHAVGALGADDELAMARALVARRLPAMSGRPPEVRIRRLVAMLARKGYGPSLAYRVVREVEAEASGSLPSDDLGPSLAVSEE